MSAPPEHPIVRVVEQIDPDETLSGVLRRALKCKRAGVREYWAVDAEARRIYGLCLRGGLLAEERMIPPDWQQTEAEFFGATTERRGSDHA